MYVHKCTYISFSSSSSSLSLPLPLSLPSPRSHPLPYLALSLSISVYLSIYPSQSPQDDPSSSQQEQQQHGKEEDRVRITCVEFSADDHCIASASAGGCVLVHSIAQSDVSCRLPRLTRAAHRLAFSSIQTDRLACAAEDGRVYIWDLPSVSSSSSVARRYGWILI